jgi:hypothetical protein
MAAAMANNQTKVPLVIASVVIASMGAASFLLLGSGGADSPTVSERAPPAATAQVAVPAPPMAEPAPAEVVAPAVSPIAEPRRAPSVQRNRMTRDVKREQIWAALGRKHRFESAAPGSAAPTEKAAAKLPELDREYIRTAITEQLIPVALECYETALADDPKLAGKVVTEFTIIGEEEVGGVVEEAVVDADESTLESEFVRECMRESLMAVTFEPPPDGGRVLVRYPFEFAPE